VGNFVKNAAGKVKEGFQKVGDGIRHVAGKVKEGFQKFGEKVKYAAGKVKDGFVKAGHWIKDNAGKVAKFGLKVWSTAVSAVGHVAGFIPIPGLGKAIGKVIGGVAKAANWVSDQIHADLGPTLNKVTSVMDKIRNPGSEYIPSITQCLGLALELL